MKWYRILFFNSKKQVKSCILNMEHECRWKVLFLIGVWILLNFLYCWVSENAILVLMVTSSNNSSSNMFTVPGIILLFSILEILLLSTITQISLSNQEKAKIEGLAILYLSHFSVTFVLNLIIVSQINHFVFVLEPLVTLAISNACIGESFKMVPSLAILFLTIGATGLRMLFRYPESLTDQSNILDASLIILISCRNITLRHIYAISGQVKIQWRANIWTSTAMFVGTLLAGLSLFRFSWGTIFSKSLLSWILYTLHTAISWTVLLKHFSPVSLAILAMTGQLLMDACIKMPMYTLQDLTTWAAFVLFSFGIILYYLNSHNSQIQEGSLSINETYTRLEFVLFLTIILTLFFYTLPPKVSSRDMKNIKYFRLDLILEKFFHSRHVSS